MQPAVSVIVPVYNGERYLRACLDSALAQTFEDIEVVAVDDGSTDATPAILAEYAACDPRVRVVTQPNGGYGRACNHGVEEARGEYLAFLESDDEMMPTMLETLHARAVADDLDICKADFYTMVGEGEARQLTVLKTCPESRFYGPVHDSTQTTALYYAMLMNWEGVFRRSFIEEHHICHNESPGAAFQDNGFWFQTFAWARRVAFVPQPLYCYRVDNDRASTKEKSARAFAAMRSEYDFIGRFVESDPALRRRLEMTYRHFRLDNLVARLLASDPSLWREQAHVIQAEICDAMACPGFSWDRFGTALRDDLQLILEDPDVFAAAPPYNINELCWAELHERTVKDEVETGHTMPAWLVSDYLDSIAEDEPEKGAA